MTKRFYQAVGLTFLLSWGLALVAKLAGIEYSGANGLIVAMAYMLTPGISVIILSKFFWKVNLKEWGIAKPKSLWFLIAWFWPIILAFTVIPISLLFPGITFTPGMEGIIARFASSVPADQIVKMQEQISSLGPLLILIIIFQSLVAGITINAVLALGEEYLWRGFLLKELKGFGWLKSSLIIGAIWGFWHAPLIIQGHNYPSHPYVGVLMMIIWCILLTPYLIYFTIRTRSVLTAAVAHGTLNASAGIAIMWISNGNDLITGVTGLAGFIVLLLFNIGLYIYDRKSKVKADELLLNY